MANYFEKFPQTVYSLTDNNTVDSVLNITTRVNFNKALKDNVAAYYEYSIEEGDTPEIVAHKVYGSASKHWVVLMFNDIVDPQYDWPLSYATLNEYIRNKYADNATAPDTGLEWAKLNRHSYYKKVTTKIDTGPEMVEYYRIDEDAYDELVEETYDTILVGGETLTITIEKRYKTYYDYENQLNDSKKNILILKPEFVKYMDSELSQALLS
jgi:hypothetical protein